MNDERSESKTWRPEDNGEAGGGSAAGTTGCLPTTRSSLPRSRRGSRSKWPTHV